MKNRRVIAFDADDTLWHNETNFEHFQAHYRALLAHYQPAATVDQALLATERRNIELYGYGIKGFHAFRRFRTTRLRELGVPEDIIRYWIGHAGAGITDRYSKLAENQELRRGWAVRAGLGFDLLEAR